jgi:hypothetical protein
VISARWRERPVEHRVARQDPVLGAYDPPCESGVMRKILDVSSAKRPSKISSGRARAARALIDVAEIE